MPPGSFETGMGLRVEQPCPQCGARIVLGETDRVLSCGYCGIKNYLQTNGVERFSLPRAGGGVAAGLLLAPYLRFKGTIYLVSESAIEHRVIDTTQLAHPLAGLPPSLGLRPQAMHLGRINPEAGNRYLPQTLKAAAILEKAAAVSRLGNRPGVPLLHRAYIGESLSTIYLPLEVRADGLYDRVTDGLLAGPEALAAGPPQGQPFREAWQTRFLAALCPQCGADLQGEGDCRVMLCANCQSAWALGEEGLKDQSWQMVAGNDDISLYLPFWRVSGGIAALDIESFADFVIRSNQPFLPRPAWHEQRMSLWVPAFKLRPKIFLQAGRQATLGQWRLAPMTGRVQPGFYPVTLPASEARQAVKVILAAASASPRRIYPHLPRIQISEAAVDLVYLPFADQGTDWRQPATGVTINKNNLSFGRAM